MRYESVHGLRTEFITILSVGLLALAGLAPVAATVPPRSLLCGLTSHVNLPAVGSHCFGTYVCMYPLLSKHAPLYGVAWLSVTCVRVWSYNLP
jgi:hypothetical protein